MKNLYKPFGIIIGLLAGLAAKQVAQGVWGVFDDEAPPKPTTEDATWGRVIAASVVQGATLSATKAVVNRSGAKAFANLTGAWPGEKRPEPK